MSEISEFEHRIHMDQGFASNAGLHSKKLPGIRDENINYMAVMPLTHMLAC